MKGLPFVLLFTAMTFVSWGAYGPVLHHGAEALNHDSMRAFVGVGFAYFLIAVLIPFALLKKNGESGRWTIVGTIYSLIAGAVGAIGALGIILALGYGGATVYVMPLVFGFAPVVNTLVTALLSRTFNQISPVFIGGILAAALGAAGVLIFKPAPPPNTGNNQDAPSAAQDATTDQARTLEFNSGVTFVALRAQEGSAEVDDQGADEPQSGDEVASQAGEASTGNESGQVENSAADSDSTRPTEDSPQDTATAQENPLEPAKDVGEGLSTADTEKAGGKTANIWGIVLSIITAALCWGSYGPMLHIGQSKMEGSRLRPFACVGIAYFVIAVIVPLLLIYARPDDQGTWNLNGMTWSILAGVAGAIGALGVILAFNAGGKPYYVMPLIFGFAPVINTFISLSEAGTWGQVSPMFWISLAVVIAGAVTVLTNAPKPKPKPAPAT